MKLKAVTGCLFRVVMKIAVIGAGIVGITSAYALAQDGHEVSVFERNAAIAEEASFANAGLLAPSLLHPLSHTRWPGAGWLRYLQAEAALALRKNVSFNELRWLLGWQKNLSSDAFVARFKQTQQLAQYGVDCLHQLSLDAGIAPEQAQGQLALFSSAAGHAAVQAKLDLLKEIGVSLLTLDRSQAQRIEPALDSDYPVHAAVHFPHDEIANCRQFAHLLKDRALECGVKFHFAATLVALHAGAPVQLEFADQPERQSFDRVVLCTGTGGSQLVGLGSAKLPLTELQQYAVSVPIREALNAPRSAIFDYDRATTIGRLGARVRVSGGTELGRSTQKVQHQSTKQLFNTLQTSFPGAASYQNGAQIWKARIGFTPDGLPLVGPSASNGVWLNLGHGHNGWSMCCGTARLLTDMLAARSLALDPASLQPARFQI